MSVAPVLISAQGFALQGGGTSGDFTVTALQDDLILLIASRRSQAFELAQITNTSRGNATFGTAFQADIVNLSDGSPQIATYQMPADGTDTWHWVNRFNSVNTCSIAAICVIRGAELAANPTSVVGNTVPQDFSTAANPFSVTGMSMPSDQPESLGFMWATTVTRAMNGAGTYGFDATGGWQNQLTYDVDLASTANEGAIAVATKLVLPGDTVGAGSCVLNATAQGRAGCFAIRGRQQDLSGFMY